MSIADIYANPQNDVYDVKTHASGPKGSLPLTGDMLRELPCGDIFGMTLDAGIFASATVASPYQEATSAQMFAVREFMRGF